ncbi:DUF2752 domain-containing protein [Parapedobacter tibetensis]|uniref:DUF2752 domain-containing protein n=1 Tax=Parapedobacter tibetensis TaxID=2972951 RepID=UPI00214D6F88|nr:DUF2752 domain-containing protein [Parapedobacter tibetensis]
MTKISHRILPSSIITNTKGLALVVCSLEGSSWLQTFLLPCPFKAVTDVDCPGCGFQRSLFALAQGNWAESYQLYPPTIPLLVVFLYALLKWAFGFDKRDTAMKIMAVACGWFVIGVYVLKLWNRH